ncbi:MAG: hypothetical protein A3H69_03440 [Candidatus Sungbacteria bacterium RIFCSPLOWO2_02_FULL_47_9]|uniref:Uncharacterized protein n=1 Tax=Candidatus Sungbacteria bacterium RIFCSPHIGHO2_01_FULL_47_32 TaxID=1802264 RepID=A0A1G2K2J2_9BACT|nr:MAG: hypothetical protein UX72_C0017G0015 [Parcubacteria group bacterium GW2011_GWA2_47_10]OGZ93632.1 MAG: hypothetical protein A2633_04735 [Candidatus Sungbacteria bacterium RIFCSPHIGHO2_01_FULL_47_32]OHA05473.1 MAG: hypothetical protein A3A28_03195 [Candidatus Sungbacteria bacterium RIFCSPLOWO2_01_FULL_47_32]OHA11577.1 MAG: hypothetical protein A3H69_03440 [Candidatus Sungbacteria bacterium RIFCSPLOWO2_02_FULL_47_9]
MTALETPGETSPTLLPEPFTRDPKGHPVFTHEFCGGDILQDEEKGVPGYRRCAKCRKKFPANLEHTEPDVMGKVCGGRFRFLDANDETGHSRPLSRRTFDRTCSACGKKEHHSTTHMIVVFKKGIFEETAKHFIRARTFTLSEIKHDTHDPAIVAMVVSIPRSSAPLPLCSYVDRLEEEHEVLMASPILSK